MPRLRAQKIPASLSRKAEAKIVREEKSVEKTTSWPASLESAPISWAIGTVETATGVQKIATRAANCAPLKLFLKRR